MAFNSACNMREYLISRLDSLASVSSTPGAKPFHPEETSAPVGLRIAAPTLEDGSLEKLLAVLQYANPTFKNFLLFTVFC